MGGGEGEAFEDTVEDFAGGFAGESDGEGSACGLADVARAVRQGDAEECVGELVGLA
jgi:hypothetical protein